MSGKKGGSSPGGNTGTDEETKARLKAEKEARKALFEQTRGAEIAAQKAGKTKGKQGKSKGGSAGPESHAQKSPAGDGKMAGQKKAEASPGISSASVSSKLKSDTQEKVDNNRNPMEANDSKGKQDTVSIDNSSVKPATAPVAAIVTSMATLKLTDSSEPKQKVSKPTKTSTAQKLAKECRAQSRVHTLFDHLPKGMEPSRLFDESRVSTEGVDPGFLALGLKYSEGQIQGSNKRVVALLALVKSFIESYVTPEDSEFKYDIAAAFKRNLMFLRKCRPFAVAMNNTVEFIHGKFRDIKIVEGKSERHLKDELIRSLQDFEEEKIKKAVEAIRDIAKSKIMKNDVVLVFGYSELVTQIIAEASKQESFSIVVVDGRPYATERRSKGLDIISQLAPTPGSEKGVQLIKYTSITGLSNVIRGVTKVILGAHALLTNGGVLAHAGTSEIALMANANNIPVIVCCETLKFCDKCPTDSFFLNEIGTGFGLIKKNTETISPEIESYLVTPVIKYDVTPAELVTAVITDVDILPCTSVPAVLRVQENKPMLS